MGEQLGFDLGAADIVLPKALATPRGRPKRARAQVEQPELVHVATPPGPARPVQRSTVYEEIRRSAQELAGIVDKVTARGRNHHQVLDDFLDLSCSTLLADDETYLRVCRAYSHDELDVGPLDRRGGGGRAPGAGAGLPN